MPIRKLFDIERYLTSFPNFSNEQCEMTLYSLLSRVFPSGQGSFWLREACDDFIQVAVLEAICQTQQSELQDSFKHNIVTKQKPEQIYNLLHVFTLTPSYSARQYLIG